MPSVIFRTTSKRKKTVMAAPMPPTSHQKRLPSRPQVPPLESDAALVSVRRRSVFMAVQGGSGGVRRESEIADANGAVRVEAEDFVKGKDDRRRSRDDRAADDAHLALVNIAAPDGEPAIDDGRNAEDEAEHHDDGKAVADAGLEVRGIETACPLRKRGQSVEEKHRRDHEHGAKPRANLGSEFFAELHSADVCCVFNGQRLFPLNHAQTITTNACCEDVSHTQN